VLMMIGQIAVMKITKIADGSLLRNAASDSGSQASGGTVRSTWKIGSRPRIAQVDCPTSVPSATPATADSAYPKATRCRLADMCQNRPLSMPPRSKNGSTISSQVSLSTRDGGGSVAPAFRHSSSQTPRMTASTTTGGTTLLATTFA